MFPQDHPMVVDGRLPTFLGIEPAAQAAATHIAILATESGREIDELDGVLAGAAGSGASSCAEATGAVSAAHRQAASATAMSRRAPTCSRSKDIGPG